MVVSGGRCYRLLWWWWLVVVIVTGCSVDGGQWRSLFLFFASGGQWWSLLQVALVMVVSGGHYSYFLGSGGQWWSLLQVALVVVVSGGHCYRLLW